MGGGGSSAPAGNTTTTTKSDPWEAQQPYLKQVMSQAQNLYQGPGPQYFPDSTVAPQSANTQAAIGMEAQRGLNGSPVTTASQNQLTDTLNGSYLSAGNPYFQGMAGNVTAQVLPQIQGQFEGAGALHSGLAARAAGLGLGDAIGSLAYQNFGDERTNQMRGLAFAPQIAGQDFQNIAALGDAGAQQDAYNQALVNANIDRFNFGQQLPANKLAQYSQFVNGNYGGTGTTTQPYYQNKGAGPVAGALGGAMGGAALGSMFGPIGTGIGAVGGGLLGLFS